MSWQAAVVLIILGAAVASTTVYGQQPLTPDAENKCGGCPCNNPCAVPSPPPPSPSPPPPSPSPPPPSPSPPPPDPKPPTPGQYCPPPPSKTPSYPSNPTPPSQYVYFTGPPGNLYPVDQSYNAGAPTSAPAGGFTVGLLMVPLLILFNRLL